MSIPMNEAPKPHVPSAMNEARVSGVDGERVRLRLVAAQGHDELLARVALMGYRPSVGDRVLLQTSDAGQPYIVAAVHAAAGASVATASGASACVEDERIALRASDGSLLAVYDGVSGELELSAPEHLKLRCPGGRLTLEAQTVDVRANATRWAVGHWELAAERIVERSHDALRSVEGLLETRARRARTLVERTLELVAHRTSVTSKEDTRIDGKRVLLG